MQRWVVESTEASIDGTICFHLESDPKVLIEEVNHFYGIREFYSISPIKKILIEQYKQRKLEAKERKCDVVAFENNSGVGE
jgi:hypothetical protein